MKRPLHRPFVRMRHLLSLFLLISLLPSASASRSAAESAAPPAASDGRPDLGTLGAPPLQGSPETLPGAVWIAESRGALKIGTREGTKLLGIRSPEAVAAVALDPQRQRVWLYFGDTLAAYSFDGRLEAGLEVPAAAPETASLALVPEDGSLWLGTKGLLLNVSPAGQILREIPGEGPIREISLDGQRGLLWVAGDRRVVAYDAVGGLEIRSLGLRAPAVDLDVEESTGRLWIAREDGLHRHDEDGEELFAAAVSGLTALAGDHQGGLWLAAGPELLHLDSAGQRIVSLRPFGEESRIDRLLFDGAHRAAWASDGRSLVKVSASGEVLARLSLDEDSKLYDLTLHQGPPDRQPPRLEMRWAGPAAASAELEIRYSDLASGVDPSTFRLRTDGGPADASACKTRAAGARCSVGRALPAGTSIEVSVRDHMGNLGKASTRWKAPDGLDAGREDDSPGARGDADELSHLAATTESLAGERIASLRGFLPAQPFISDGEIEAINTANGNLNLSIPLGQVFTVGPLIRYQLRVTHNSDAWSHRTVSCNAPSCTVSIPETLVALPQRSNNAGISWELHFGKLFPPQKPQGLDKLDSQTWPNNADPFGTDDDSWLYVSPDGSSHTLHALPGRTTTSRGGLPVLYSKDGSHLRMRQTHASTVIVEHPNGTISQFEQSNESLGTLGCGGGVTGCWRFREMRDYYGNKVSVEYLAISGGERWKISDSTGRVSNIFFKTDNASRRGGDSTASNKLRLANGDELGDLLRVVDKVQIAAFGSAVAEYTFTYQTKTVSRSNPHDPRDHLGSASATMKVPVLTQISVPDSQPYKFLHYFDSNKSGRVRQVTLPTQGQYRYEYGIWRFPTACVYTQTQEEVDADYYRYGIRTKKHWQPGAGVVATWTYSNSISPPIAGSDRSGPTCKRANVRRTQLDGPTVGNRFTRQEFFNSVTQGPKNPSSTAAISTWQITDNGLPLDKDQRIGGSNADYLFLSERVSDCIGGTCTVQREKYVRYASEWRACAATLIFRDPPSCFQIDPVRVRERTIFRDDGSKWLERKNTHHTGAGHTQNEFTIDNFNNSTRTVEHRTDYEAGASTARPESSTTGYINMGTPSTYLPATGSRWILTPFSSRTLIDSGRTYVTTYDFNNQGVLECSRKRRFAGFDHPTDLVNRLTLGASAGANAGLAELETVAGGSNGSLAAGVCNTNGTEGNNKFTFDHGYQHLIRSSTRIGNFPYRFRATIDRNTGLPSVRFNPADQRTFFTYDRLGRATRVTPSDGLNEAEILMTYNSSAGAQASIDIERKLGGTVYGTELLIYDYFGRLRRELQSIPTGQSSSARSERETVYDGLGRVSAISTVQQASNVNNVQNTTRFFGYDPFGRPSQIRKADDTTETLTYKGVREAQSKVSIRTSQTGSSEVTTTRTFDGLGRETILQNPVYFLVTSYDPNGRVVKLERRNGSGASQVREFGWDNRELLVWEKHPEIGTSSANGTISFAPDALGNTRTLFDGLHSLTHEYDGDGRLLKVREGSRLWQEFTWANSNAGSDYRKGKVVQAIRHNYPPPGADWAIVEDYEYKGRLGKISHRRTQLRWPENAVEADRYAHTFDQSWVYDALGDVISTVYPTCITTPQNGRRYCNDPADQQPPAHTVTRTMNHGLPVRISSNLGLWANYQYHWNYQLKRIDYSNAAYTELAQGTRGMQRPASIAHYGSNQAQLFSTGPYQYDEAGNIWAMGADRYVYDGANRLIRGTAGSASRWEAYSYDYKDNLYQVQRDGASPARFNIDGKNRLVGNFGAPPDTIYDGAGNVERVGPAQNPLFDLDHDSLNMVSTVITQFPAPAEEYFAYGPGNLRILSYNATTGERFWTFRDQNGKILREHRVTGWGPYQSAAAPGEKWEFQKDYVYGPNGILATRDAAGAQRFFHTDHLGSPRLITNTFGGEAGRHTYYPYGVEASSSGVDERVAKFTGHELDRHGASYYMLARSYIPLWLRFAQVDPARDGWNLYGYVGGNPVNAIDPLGLYTCTATQDQCSSFEEARQANLGRGGAIGATATAFGDPGQDNGVTVTFGATEPGAAANVQASIDFVQGSGFSLTATATIAEGLSGVLLEAAVGHEGQHLVDAQAFFSTITESGSFDLSRNLTIEDLETKAFQITHSILKASNTPMKFRGASGPVELGRLSSKGKLNRAITNILGGPLYSHKLDRRQFPEYSP